MSARERIEELFYAATEHPVAERRQFVSQACDGDPALEREVLELLRAEESSARFLGGLGRPLDGRGQLGPFSILEHVGRGGCADVYLVEDRRLGRRAALKVLPDEAPSQTYRFTREARAASALNHPNILTVYETGEIDSVRFIATEFVEGRTLREVITGGKQALRASLDFAIQIAAALAAAHEAGIVHRDIKPENVMVRKDGYVKVLDFGLAKLLPLARADVTKLTQQGVVMGTIGYMSPEQLRGDEVDPRSDVFSAGVVLFELLTGRLPFEGRTTSDLIASILRTAPELDHVDARVRACLAKALSKEAAHRHASAATLLVELQEIAADIDTGVRLAVRPRRHPRFRTAAIGLLVLIAGVFLLAPSGSGVASIAVLPLATQPGIDDYVSCGIADNIIGRLSQLSDLRVMSMQSVRDHPTEEGLDARVIGRELGVDSVLFGYARLEEDRVIVEIELVATRDLRRLWGARYRSSESRISRLPETIARQVAQCLRPNADAEVLARVEREDTRNPQAHRLYSKGRYFWNLRSEASLRRAIRAFEGAIELDAGFALAWSGLADCHALLANYSSVSPRASIASARAAAQRALELDDTLAEAHASLGLIKKDHDWDFDGAEESFARAVLLQPSYASAHQWRGENYLITGHPERALDAIRRARRLDPTSPIINGEIGWVLNYSGRPEAAITRLLEALEIDHDFARTHFFLGRAYANAGRFSEAIASLENAVSLSRRQPLYLGALAQVHGKAGHLDRARTMLDELLDRNEREHISAVALAVAFVGLGDIDRALASLERARTVRDTALAYFVGDPMLADLRELSAFRTLVKKVGLTPRKPTDHSPR